MLIARTTPKARLRRDKLHLAQLGREFDVCASQLTLKHMWANDILERAQQAAELVTALLSAKYIQILISNNMNVSRLAELSQQDGQNTLAISKAMKNDSSTMKFIAILAVLYAPGTFVAVSRTSLPNNPVL
ncbi:MAG: hypothetical protein Q9201_003461 [Fulgogasparrea decipioides]